MLLTPIFFYNTLQYTLGDQKNYFYMLFMELLIAILGIIFLSKLKNKLFNERFPIMNIILFYIVALLCSVAGYIAKKINVPVSINIISLFGCIVIYVMYILFTICPPKKEIFKDPTTGTYGVTCVNNIN